MDKVGSKKRVIISLIFTAIWIAVYFIVPFEGLDAAGKLALVVFLWALTMWIIRPIPEYIIAMSAVTLLMVFGGVGVGKVTSGFSGSSWWVILFACMLGGMLTVTGLGERIAYAILLKMGTSHLKVSYATTISTIILSAFTPSGTARGAIISSITDGICNSMGYKPGEYKGDHGLMLSNLYANAACTWIFLTAGGSTIIGTGLLLEMTGRSIGWIDYFVAASVPCLILFALIPLICYKLFPVDKNAAPPDLTFVREHLAKMGKISKREKTGLVIMCVILALWLTQNLTGFDANTVAFILGVALLFPTFGPVKWKEIESIIPWRMLLWLGFALSLASYVNSTGGFEWLVNTLFVGTPLFESLSFNGMLMLLIPIIIFAHIMFSGLDAMVTILVPIAITIAQARGFDVYTFGLICLMACVTGAYFLPFNMAPNMIFMGTGRFNVSHQLKGGVIIAIITCLLFYLCLFVWWPIVGIL